MSLAIRAQAQEQMDAVDLNPAEYRRILGDLGRANRWTLAARPTLAFLSRATLDMDRFTLLDVGFGDGGMLRAISQWAERHDKRAILTGVDLNPGSAPFAAAITDRRWEIDWRTGDYRALGKFDFIISSLTAHHMRHQELIGFLRHMDGHSGRGWFVNDLHRHRFAHAAYPLLARLMGWHRIVREDGTLSIARSFRPAEWLG